MNIMNKKLDGDGVPEDWRCSATIPIYKSKGDALECSKYRGVRLLKFGMKVYEGILDNRLKKVVDIES